jgi:hypothetical protein
MRKKDWEKEFAERFVNHGEFIYNKGGYPAMCGEIKQFISQLLKQQRKEILRDIRKMKKHPKIKTEYPELGKLKIDTQDFDNDIAYNQAIDDIIKLLTK